MDRYLNFTFYRFLTFPDLNSQVDFQSQALKLAMACQLKGTVLLSPEGINGSLVGQPDSARCFQAFLTQQLGIKNYKESYSHQIPFQELFFKLKKEIIAFGKPEIQPEYFTAPYLKPKTLKAWLDHKKEFTLLDTRNEYEISQGTFAEARHLQISHFREFPNKLSQTFHASKPDLQKPMVTFCTGGVRCEKASAFALQLGFKEVYQLQGGILDYFKDCGAAHYEGNCFVFDERIALTPELNASWGLSPTQIVKPVVAFSD